MQKMYRTIFRKVAGTGGAAAPSRAAGYQSAFENLKHLNVGAGAGKGLKSYDVRSEDLDRANQVAEAHLGPSASIVCRGLMAQQSWEMGDLASSRSHLEAAKRFAEDDSTRKDIENLLGRIMIEKGDVHELAKHSNLGVWPALAQLVVDGGFEVDIGSACNDTKVVFVTNAVACGAMPFEALQVLENKLLYLDVLETRVLDAHEGCVKQQLRASLAARADTKTAGKWYKNILDYDAKLEQLRQDGKERFPEGYHGRRRAITARALVGMANLYHKQDMAIQSDGLYSGALDKYEMIQKEFGQFNLPRLIGWHHEALTGRAKLLRSWDKRDSEAAQLESAADKLWEGQALSAEQRERLCALILPPIDIPKTLWGGDE